MTDEEIIKAMAKAMAEAVRDTSWSHYVKPARAAFEVVKQHYEPSTEASAGAAS